MCHGDGEYNVKALCIHMRRAKRPENIFTTLPTTTMVIFVPPQIRPKRNKRYEKQATLFCHASKFYDRHGYGKLDLQAQASGVKNNLTFFFGPQDSGSQVTHGNS